MNNSSIFIITTFSPYEEIYKNNFRFKIDEKALKKELNEIDKSDKKTFLKRILKRQTYSYHTSPYQKIFNPFGKQKGKRDQRSHMFFFSFKEAEKALKKGYSDLWESGSNGNPSIACIEEYRPGFNIQISFKRCFYSCYFNRIRKNNNLFIKIKVKKIKEPKWAKGTTNFALG